MFRPTLTRFLSDWRAEASYIAAEGEQARLIEAWLDRHAGD
jgi:hypothetical protein